MYTTIGTFYSFYMIVCCPGPGDNKQSYKKIISTNCFMHTVVPHDDGPRYARNM